MRSAIPIARLASIAVLTWLGSGALGAIAPAPAAAAGAHIRIAAPQQGATVAWPGRPFAPNSVWNRPLSRSAPLSAHSRSFVDEIVRQANDYGPWLNTWSYSTPVYLVPAGESTTRVTLDTWGPDLQASWDAVPLPANAVPSKGSDGQLTVWQPSTNRLWEFWKLHRVHGAWHARWGGEMQDVSHNPGYFTHSATTNDWGATATGLPLLGGLITTADLQRGYIDHALAISLVETAPRYYAWPAQRTDGYVFTPAQIGRAASLGINSSAAADMFAQRRNHTYVRHEEVGIEIRIAATDHHEVDALRQPFVAEWREFDEIGPQRLERFQCVGKVTAESLILGVSHTQAAAAAITAVETQEVGLIGKGTRSSQFTNGFGLGVFPKTLSERVD